MAQDKTSNYQFALPNPVGIQIAEMQKVVDSIIAIDAKLKASETALSTHKHAFAEITEKPTTLEGYGITDGMTAAETAAAIKAAIDGLVNGSGAALDTLKELADALGNDPEFATTVGNALGLRVRVDASQGFSLAQKAQGRGNLDALGIVDKGKANGVASLDGTGKVPATQLPEMNYLPSGGGRLRGAVRVQVGDNNGAASIVSGDDAHTGYLEGWLPDGNRGFFFGWAAKAGRVALSTENGVAGLELNGDLIVKNGFGSDGPGSTRGVFRNTGAGDSWIQFFARDYAASYAEFGLRGDGTAYAWVNGKQFNFYANGDFGSPGKVVARGEVHAWDGAQSGILYADGNLSGSIWLGWGSAYAFAAINAQIEKRAREYADDRKNGCVTDSRYAGWVQVDVKTGSSGGGDFNFDGYVVTRIVKSGNEMITVGGRMPQIFIPAVGWRWIGPTV